MSNRSLADLDPFKHRSIIYHGKNSMTEMGLMMIGNTPLSQLTPKTVTEEIAYADGDLDLSEADGKLYFETREITYTFISIEDYNRVRYGKPVLMHRQVTDTTHDIYAWLYQTNDSKTLWLHDIDEFVPPGSPVDHEFTVTEYELYDYAYGRYKFMNVRKPTIEISKAMFNDCWIEQISITFRVDPYLQTLVGNRIEIATMADHAINSRNMQSAIMVYTNNRYYIRDFDVWLNGHDDGVMLTNSKWRFFVRVQYTGSIGMRLSPSCSVNENQYTVVDATGLTWLDNEHPGETFEHHAGGYGYGIPSVDSTTGEKRIILDVTFDQNYTPDTAPWIHVEWGVLRNYVVPDQNNYYVEAYSNHSPTLYVGAPGYGQEVPFSTRFSLEVQPLNEIHIRNYDYDGLYKWRYDTTSRRLS